MIEPRSQQYRHFSFVLVDENQAITFITLPIRPEELTRTEPSRASVVNSLDGAWVDSFGRGLTTLTISGNTGWRIKGDKGDGINQFMTLRDDFIHAWHTSRRAKIDAGGDPNEVRLIFMDALNSFYVADVVPMSFTLRRSKSQPLLMLYNLTMTVIKEGATTPKPELFEENRPTPTDNATAASVASAASSEAKIKGLIGDLESLTNDINNIGKNALALTKSTFGPAIEMANTVIATAQAAKRTLDAAEQAVVNVAGELSATATKMWEAAAEVASIPAYAKSKIMQVKGAFSNLSCVLSNGFAAALNQKITGLDVYGASNCSSTSGGSPPSATAEAGTNPFEYVVVPPPAIEVNPAAAKAIQEVKAIDITVTPIDYGLLSRATTSIQTGVKFNAN